MEKKNQSDVLPAEPLKNGEFAINAGAKFNTTTNSFKFSVKPDGTATLTLELSFKIDDPTDITSKPDDTPTYWGYALFNPTTAVKGFANFTADPFYLDVAPGNYSKIAFLTNSGEIVGETFADKREHGSLRQIFKDFSGKAFRHLGLNKYLEKFD